MSPRLLRILLTAVVALCAAACGNETPPASTKPVEKFCTEGAKVCQGNYVATCVEGGKAYQLAFCGGSKFCSNGVCENVLCPKGKLSCGGPKNLDVMKCPDDGASDATKVETCTKACKDGACLPEPCKKDEARCGASSLFVCTSGVWQETACTGDQICDTTQKACIARTCAPETKQCKDGKTAQTCSTKGDTWVNNACSAGQACYSGVCHAEVVGKSPDGTTDAGSTSQDTSSPGGSDASVSTDAPGFLDIPKKEVILQAPDTFKVILSETKQPAPGTEPKSFDATVFYSDSIKALQVSGDKDLFKIEISVGPIEEFTTGTFTALGGEAGESAIRMNDGTTDQTKIQWKYESVDYTVTIDEFGEAGGRIKGKFSGEMLDATDPAKKKKLYLIDGVFDVAR